MSNPRPRIGSLRWPATLVARSMQPDPNGTGIIEVDTIIQKVHIDIEPISLKSASGMLTLVGDGEQIETPVTHRCLMRWHPYQLANMFNILIRNTSLPDFTELTETYRIRRMHELDGRKRYLVCDVELIKYEIT